MPFIGDTIQTTPSGSISPTVQGGPPGLGGQGVIGLSIVTNANPPVVVVPRTTSGIVELIPNSGIYARPSTAAPSTAGEFAVVWDDGAGDFGSQDLLVVTDPSPPPTPAPGADAAGPCERWIDG